MLNPLRLRALTQITLTRRISSSSILHSNPISNPPDSQSATAQQHPNSSSSTSKSETGPGASAGSPSTSATDSKSNKSQNQDRKEADESVPGGDMNTTQYGTGEAVEGPLTEQSGEKERRGDA